MRYILKLIICTLIVYSLYCCSNDESFNHNNEVNYEKIIAFSSYKKPLTRANYTGGDAASLLNYNFVVEGVKGDGTNQELVFDHYNVNYIANTAGTTSSNTADWEYVDQTVDSHSSVTNQSIKYWDYDHSQYDFMAYSLAGATGLTISNMIPSILTTSAYTISGSANELTKVYISDLTTVYQQDNLFGNTVTLTFRQLASKIRIGLYEMIPGYSVKDVIFYTDANTKAIDGNAYLYTSNSGVYNETGTYKIYFPTVGYSNKTDEDYNRAHIEFTANSIGGTSTTKNFGPLYNFASKEISEANDNYIGRTSATATYAGISTNNYYISLLPNETGSTLNIKLDFTLVSIDGTGETINITGANATIPSYYAVWKHGYAYTYLFKLSENTNGYTGDPNTSPSGLFPITFDCIVIEDVNGNEERIINM